MQLGSPEAIRVACFGIISSIARVGGGVFWQQGGGNFVEVVKVCVTGLGDHSQVLTLLCTGTIDIWIPACFFQS